MAAVVGVSSADRVVTITLDSPGNRNALSRQLVGELAWALSSVAADESVHAVLLTHTGQAFCSGAALDEMRSGDNGPGTADMLGLFRLLLTLPVPVVALVDGATRAGGLGLLGACDIVLASPQSTFAFTEVRLGLAPAIISLPLRPLLDPRAASLYFLTGSAFDAETAARIGLITSVGGRDDADEVLSGLRKADRQGLVATRPLTTRDRLRALDEEGDAMASLSARLFSSPVAQEHFAAFFRRD